ncbi:MAG: helicase HerA-like domain-containing protein [Candidatus Bathyarchaeia archaeon]
MKSILEFANVLDKGKRTKEFLRLPLSQLKNHILLVGGSGSGKTHFARALLEEILAQGTPVIAVDSQGDLLWLTRVTGLKSSKKKKLAKLEKRVFTPDYPHGAPFVIAPVLFSRSKEGNRPLIRYWIRSILRTIGYELKPGQTSPQEYQLTQVAGKLVEGHQSLSLESLFVRASEESPKWTIDKTAAIAPEDAKELVSRLGALLSNDRDLYVGESFDVRNLVDSKAGGLWIIYLVHLPIETRQLVLNWVCDSVYHWMMSDTSTQALDRPRLVMFVDEAADYVTEANLPEYRQSLFRLLNQGRKYGVGLVLAVQTPRGLPPEVLNNCAVKIFGAVDEPGDVEGISYSTGLDKNDLAPLQNRSWRYAFVVRIPGAQSCFCKARDLITRKGRPLAPGSSGMIRILKFLHQFIPNKS